jgi:hypothetical protein
MPKLLVFAPCEKVIISQDENNPTLIAILSRLTLQGDDTSFAQVASEAKDQLPMVPMRWAIFTMWLREPSDGTREFTQTIDIESPGGKVVITHRNSFAFTSETNTHRISLGLPGIPGT